MDVVMENDLVSAWRKQGHASISARQMEIPSFRRVWQLDVPVNAMCSPHMEGYE